MEARIAEMRGEVEKLEAARAALVGAATTNGRATERRTPNRRRRPTAPRKLTLTDDAIVDAVRSGHDQATAIASAFGTSVSVVRKRLTELEKAGQLKPTGERSQRRWLPAT